MLRANQFQRYEVIIKMQVVAICDAVLEANPDSQKVAVLEDNIKRRTSVVCDTVLAAN